MKLDKIIMEVVKSKKTIYSIGILWNLTARFARQMMLEIATENPIVQVRVYNLGESYMDFVKDCYKNDKEAQEDGYINIKVARMMRDKSSIKKAILFVARIDNPIYILDEEKGKVKCEQVVKLKRKYRAKYQKFIEDYFFDVLFHMSDDSEELEDILKILPKYEKFIQEEYIRKGHQEYLKRNESIDPEKETDSYCTLLKTLQNDVDRGEL